MNLQPLMVRGVIRVCELEGCTFELERSDPGESIQDKYVLIPQDDAVAGEISARKGRHVAVRGYIHRGPSIYMRGNVLRVTEVLDAEEGEEPKTGDRA